jgi:tyrosyl-tRNA synthetase
MTIPKSSLLTTLAARGFIHQCTDLPALDAHCCVGPVHAYIGFDATADSLHAGHLLQIMVLRWLQRTGHKPIVLIGGATTRLGDPSFRDTSRPILADAEIERNKAAIQQTLFRLVTFGNGPTDAVLLDNSEWLDPLQFLGFLREFGPHFTVNRMLAFESVRSRLEREQPLTLLEFNYMVLQAFDFLELARREKCLLQVGGSDQWGNILNGIELARRIDQRQLFGLTTPLLSTAAGMKMGKTMGGAVWLDPDRLSPYAFWQCWRNTDDADVPRFLRLFTELPLDEVGRLAALKGADSNAAKIALANEVTAIVHGRVAAEAAAETARQAFEGVMAEGLPTVDMHHAVLRSGVPVAQLLVMTGLSASKSDARRLIRGGGAKLNDVGVLDEDAVATSTDLTAGMLKLAAGRKRHALVRAV